MEEECCMVAKVGNVISLHSIQGHLGGNVQSSMLVIIFGNHVNFGTLPTLPPRSIGLKPLFSCTPSRPIGLKRFFLRLTIKRRPEMKDLKKNISRHHLILLACMLQFSFVSQQSFTNSNPLTSGIGRGFLSN